MEDLSWECSRNRKQPKCQDPEAALTAGKSRNKKKVPSLFAPKILRVSREDLDLIIDHMIYES